MIDLTPVTNLQRNAGVLRALTELVELRGAPLSIRLDNGPEFIADALAKWAQSKSIALQHIQPGKPSENAYVERFNQTYRTEVLDCYVFEHLSAGSLLKLFATPRSLRAKEQGKDRASRLIPASFSASLYISSAILYGSTYFHL